MAGKYRVALVKGEDIAASVRKGLELVGGIGAYVRPGARVVIKVNMFTRATPESAKVTHPAVVLEVARLCHQAGARVSVVERVPHFDYIFQGYEQVREVAELVPLEKVEHRHQALPGARSLTCQVPWPNLVDECDVFINIPGLRTHALTKFSNGMKNLMGLLPDQATMLIHHHGLDGSICDINYYRSSDLVVTDAIYTLEGNFPSEGSAVKTDLITVATNVVAADLVGTRLMGVDAGEVLHLQEAIARGLGPASLDDVELVGDNLESVAAGFRIEQAPRDPERHKGHFRLSTANACASCRQALAGGLLAVSHRPELAALEDVTILCGQQAEGGPTPAGKVLVYGNCAYRYRHLGQYEPGCPPLAYQVARGLGRLRVLPMRPALRVDGPDQPIEQALTAAAAAGFPAVELTSTQLDAYGEEHGGLGALADTLRGQGLQVVGIDTPSDVAASAADGHEVAQRYAAQAPQLGASLVRVSAGSAPSAAASTATWRAAEWVLRHVCETARKHETGLAISIKPGCLHDTVESALRLVRQVGMPNLGVDLDLAALEACGEDAGMAVKRLLPWLCSVHVGGLKGNRAASAFLSALGASSYQGPVIVSSRQDAAADLAVLRRALGQRLAKS